MAHAPWKLSWKPHLGKSVSWCLAPRLLVGLSRSRATRPPFPLGKLPKIYRPSPPPPTITFTRLNNLGQSGPPPPARERLVHFLEAF